MRKVFLTIAVCFSLLFISCNPLAEEQTNKYGYAYITNQTSKTVGISVGGSAYYTCYPGGTVSFYITEGYYNVYLKDPSFVSFSNVYLCPNMRKYLGKDSLGYYLKL